METQKASGETEQDLDWEVIQLRALEKNKKQFLMILIWVLVKILQQHNQSNVM